MARRRLPVADRDRIAVRDSSRKGVRLPKRTFAVARKARCSVRSSVRIGEGVWGQVRGNGNVLAAVSLWHGQGGRAVSVRMARRRLPVAKVIGVRGQGLRFGRLLDRSSPVARKAK